MASKKFFLAAGLVGIGSGIYTYYKSNSVNSPIIRDFSKLQTLENKPKYTSAKMMKGVKEVPNLNLTLYQFQNCPFSCKVRAFLDYSGITYNVVEVSPFNKKKALSFSPIKKVPIVVADNNKVLVDSSAIISILGTYLFTKKENQTFEDVLKLYPLVSNISEKDLKKNNLDVENKYHLMYGEDPKTDAFYKSIKEEANWREWVDKKLVITITPNIYRSLAETRQAIKYFDKTGNWEEVFSSIQRIFALYPGTLAMYLLGKSLKRKHHLDGEARSHIYKACNDWTKAIGKKRLFMGGIKPNLADLAVYGTLNSIEGCDTFKDLLKHTQIGPWYFRVQAAVDSHMGAVYLKEHKPN